MRIPPELLTNVNFDRRVSETRNEWNVVDHDIETYITARRPSSSSSRPEVVYGEGLVAVEYEWWWARMIDINNNVEIGDRLQRLDVDGNVDGELDDLFILQIDTIAHVQQLILSIREGSR